MAKKVTFAAKPEPKSADDWVENRANEETKRLTVDVPASLHRRIKAQCALQGKKMADVFREILEEKFPA